MSLYSFLRSKLCGVIRDKETETHGRLRRRTAILTLNLLAVLCHIHTHGSTALLLLGWGGLSFSGRSPNPLNARISPDYRLQDWLYMPCVSAYMISLGQRFPIRTPGCQPTYLLPPVYSGVSYLHSWNMTAWSKVNMHKMNCSVVPIDGSKWTWE